MRTYANALRTTLGTNQPQPPPRNLIAQTGPRSALVTWNAPPAAHGPLGIVAWRVYVGNENNFLAQVAEPTRQATVPLQAGQTTNVYVSSVTQQGIESAKIPVAVVGGASTVAPPSLPPGYQSEPTGGGFSQTRVP